MAGKKNNLEEINTKISNCWQRILDAGKKQTDILNKKCETLKGYIKNDFELTRLYTQAMSFLNWFDFDKLYSNKLRKEASTKKYSELTKYNTFHSYSEYALKFIDDTNYRTISLDTSIRGDVCISDWCVNTDYNKVKNIYIDGHQVELERDEDLEENKIKWEETVDYIVNRPFEFDEGIIISVYNYLKEIIEKDKQIKKYKNERNN